MHLEVTWPPRRLAGAALDALHPSGPGIVPVHTAMTGLGFGVPRHPSLDALHPWLAAAALAVAAAALAVAAAGRAEARTSADGAAAVLSLAAGAGFLSLAAGAAGVSREAHDHSRALLDPEAATRAAREEAAVLAGRGRLARVKTHVNHLPAKTGCRDRAAPAGYACRTGRLAP
ncbi:hypothetical protein ACQP2P_29760 [Dactylosporangium sp. CA-139114]|uniref:hypothetical protein n=1 Tax=Dactylosporangium sp. CA-139114 TaxID=3239931 RepID=UPI003D96AC06